MPIHKNHTLVPLLSFLFILFLPTQADTAPTPFHFHKSTSISILQKNLHHKHRWNRRDAILSLGIRKAKQALPALVSIAKNPKNAQRNDALWAIAFFGAQAKNTIPTLRKIIDSRYLINFYNREFGKGNYGFGSSDFQRMRNRAIIAVYALAMIQTQPARKALLSAYTRKTKEDDADIRSTIIWSLCRFSTKNILSTLLKALSDRSINVRLASISCIKRKKLHNRFILKALAKQLTHEHSSVRNEALSLLKNFGRKSSLVLRDIIQYTLSSSSLKESRFSPVDVGKTLAAIGSSSLPYLLKFLSHKHRDVRHMAADCLQQIKGLSNSAQKRLRRNLEKHLLAPNKKDDDFPEDFQFDLLKTYIQVLPKKPRRRPFFRNLVTQLEGKQLRYLISAFFKKNPRSKVFQDILLQCLNKKEDVALPAANIIQKLRISREFLLQAYRKTNNPYLAVLLIKYGIETNKLKKRLLKALTRTSTWKVNRVLSALSLYTQENFSTPTLLSLSQQHQVQVRCKAALALAKMPSKRTFLISMMFQRITDKGFEKSLCFLDIIRRIGRKSEVKPLQKLYKKYQKTRYSLWLASAINHLAKKIVYPQVVIQTAIKADKSIKRAQAYRKKHPTLSKQDYRRFLYQVKKDRYSKSKEALRILLSYPLSVKQLYLPLLYASYHPETIGKIANEYLSNMKKIPIAFWPIIQPQPIHFCSIETEKQHKQLLRRLLLQIVGKKG